MFIKRCRAGRDGTEGTDHLEMGVGLGFVSCACAYVLHMREKGRDGEDWCLGQKIEVGKIEGVRKGGQTERWIKEGRKKSCSNRPGQSNAFQKVKLALA